MRKIIVSDVHGCYAELIKLLNKINFDKLNDEIIFIGDIMDRGPNSYEVFNFVKQLKEDLKDKCHYILGNHDMMVRDKDIGTWNMNGSKATIDSFNEHGDYPFNYCEWIKENTEIYLKVDEVTICHGGLCRWHHLDTIETESEENIVWDRTMVEHPWYVGPLFIIGHTPLLNSPLYISGKEDLFLEYETEYSLSDFQIGVIDIDTACVYGNALTAMVIDDDRFVFYKVDKEKLEEK